MLQADYEKLPAFPVPAHVSDNAERFQLLGSCAHLYRFNDGSIGLWWASSERRDKVLMPLVEGRAVWNRMGKHWHMAADAADEVVRDLERLGAERLR